MRRSGDAARVLWTTRQLFGAALDWMTPHKKRGPDLSEPPSP